MKKIQGILLGTVQRIDAIVISFEEWLCHKRTKDAAVASAIVLIGSWLELPLDVCIIAASPWGIKIAGQSYSDAKQGQP